MGRKVPGIALAVILVAFLPWHGSPRAESDESACSAAIATVAEINASALFQGAIACAQRDRHEDTNFLMIVGQIRAMTDLSVLIPTDDANSQKAGELYGLIFYQFGGLGYDDVYRTSASVDAFEERIRSLDLQFFDGYDPGWSYKSSSKTDLYAIVLSNTRENRIWQIRNMALKLQNDQYYEAHKAFAELQRQNPVFEAGTPAYEEHIRLMKVMDDAAKDIPALPPPEDTIPYARLAEQDPEMAELQVTSGFNGPATQDTYIFRSETEIHESWLVQALSHEEFEALVAKIDFSKHILVGFAFGERSNASGQIVITELRYSESSKGYVIATQIGVVPESCGVSFTESYPFVFGIAESVPGAEIRAESISNFPDECGPIMSGKPATQP